jgi:glycosyltransferase involved in cell wall biosynthesis
MNILYIAPFVTDRVLQEHGTNNTSVLAGSKKVSMISNELARRGQQVVILSSYMSSRRLLRWRRNEEEQLGESVRVLYPAASMLRPLGSILNWARTGSIMRNLIATFRPDAAIVYNSHVFEAFCTKHLLRLLGPIPILLEIEDLPHARKRGWVSIKPRLDQMCWKSLLANATAFTAVNEAIFDKLPTDKPRTLMPGIIAPLLVERFETRQSPFSKRKKTLGYFGALGEEKGVGVLLKLILQLPADWRVVVTGMGPLSGELAALGERYPDRLRFLGRVEDYELCQMLCECDCTLIPREHIGNSGEGVFPFKTFEYIVSGSHIIGSNLPRSCGVDLSFIKPFDGTVTDLLQALSTAHADYLATDDVRQQTRSEIVSLYGMRAVGERILGLLFATRDTAINAMGRSGDLAATYKTSNAGVECGSE